MKRVEEKNKRRLRRKMHIRKRINGTKKCPRMSVFKSNRHVYVQVIDDLAGATLASASTLESESESLKKGLETGKKIGSVIGKRLKEKKIKRIVFDRNGYKYHGIVKAIADGTRAAGIEF